jgi:hypothetical protein
VHRIALQRPEVGETPDAMQRIAKGGVVLPGRRRALTSGVGQAFLA